jgi:hypothetical protein
VLAPSTGAWPIRSSRLIGTIRRDLLDHVIVFGERHLLRLLQSFFDDYYHDWRCHQSLDGNAPNRRAVEAPDRGGFVPLPPLVHPGVVDVAAGAAHCALPGPLYRSWSRRAPLNNFTRSGRVLTVGLHPVALGACRCTVDLQFLVARRQAHLPGRAVVFLSGISGAKGTKAAAAAGLAKASDIVALCVEGPNKAGAASQITRRLADAGINLRGVSAGVMGKRFQLFLAFDNAADADKAARSLRAAGGKK